MTPATIAMLSKAFAGNPIHVRAFGADRVLARNDTFFRVGLSVFGGDRLAALDGSRLVGFAHWVESPGCRVTAVQRVRLLPALVRGLGIRASLRVSAWLSAWAANDPADAHWHFGPIGVDPDFQGRGVGRQLMTAFCAALDERSASGFLETDKPENVRFYERSGFGVIGEVPVIGVPTYFMARSARR